MLAGGHRVRITREWPDAEWESDEVMLALHARRSAASVQAWSVAHPGRALAVVLTGTDLYPDIGSDGAAVRSLELAQRLVVLQELGLRALPPRFQAKARVVYQSTTLRRTLAKSERALRAVMVGHLRDVKSPRTLFEAARLLHGNTDIRIDHIGEASDESLGRQARATQRDCPGYRWLGGLPHGQARQRIQRAHVLVHTSALEGGAHVIMEAVCSGTPVLASRVDGNVGMLGAAYGGYFPHGDAPALARLLRQCRAGQPGLDPAGALLARLRAQCALRAPLFAPDAERAAVTRLIHDLYDSP